MANLTDLFQRWRDKLLGPSASADSAAPASPGPRQHQEADELRKQGLVFVAQQQWPEAERCANELIRCGARAHAQHVQACIAQAQGRDRDAAALFESAIADDPNDSNLYTEAGLFAARRNDLEEAEYLFSHALRCDARDTRAHVALGELLVAQERVDAAAEHFAMVLQSDPSNVEVRQRLAHIYWQRGELPRVAKLYQDGLALAPDLFEFHLRLGNCYRELGDLVGAHRHTGRALELKPGHVSATLAHAQVLMLTGKPDQAEEHVRALLRADPDNTLAHWTLALILLKEGKFAEAWPHHEIGVAQRLQGCRFGVSSKPWRGEPLAGKRVLIYGEQGLGDEIMFASCIPDLLNVVSSCVIECAPKLEHLFACSFPQATVHAGRKNEGRNWLDGVGPVDFEIPSGTLPSVLRRTESDFPVTPFLRVPDASRDRWVRQLDELGPGLKVGISWRGGTKKTGVYARSIPLSEWLPILRVPGVKFINLQYTDCAEEINAVVQAVGTPITTWHDALNDYLETAALVASLDLVITVCTSIVFVASGLGKPVWVMAPPGASWRYVRGQRHTPWAPTADVYWKQGDSWAPVIDAVATTLAATAGVAPATTASRESLRDVVDAVRRHLVQGDKHGALQLLRATPLPSDASSDALFDWGLLYRDAGDPAGAEKVWLQAMQLPSIDPRIANNLAVLNLKAQRLDEALRFARQAVAVAPDFVPGQVNLGIIFTLQGDTDSAQVAFNRALELDPDNLDAVRNMVMLYDEMGDRDAALRMLRSYLRLAPQEPDALYLASVYALRRGELASGWVGYEHRWSRLGPPKRLKGIPVWSGESLHGKQLLITDEQGIGDQMLFASCLPDVVRAGAEATLLCAPKLKNIFVESFPKVAVLASGAGHAELSKRRFDFQVAIGSLPLFFRQRIDQVAATGPYLRSPTVRRDRCRQRLDALGSGMKVGLSWRGGMTRTGQLLRSIPLEQWQAILTVPGVHFVNLQYTECADEVAAVERAIGIKLHTWQEVLDDYAETAALTGSLDLVISVCTSIVSLASGLGQSIWVLTPVSAGWMFQDSGEHTPWFPSARLFRQRVPLQWSEQLKIVAKELARMARSDG